MIVGISGKARSGKDELAKIAVAEFGARQTSFAMTLKREVAGFLLKYSVEWDDRHLFGSQQDKECNLRLLDLADVVAEFPEFKEFAELYGDTEWFPDVLVFTPRALMQWWGTEFRRAQDENYWVTQTLAVASKEPGLWVISDCRFPNEAAAIRAAGGVLVRIDRPDGPIPSNPDHPSETGLDDWPSWDIMISNSDTLATYHAMCRGTMERVNAGLY